jgi:hypothetical protein
MYFTSVSYDGFLYATEPIRLHSASVITVNHRVEGHAGDAPRQSGGAGSLSEIGKQRPGEAVPAFSLKKEMMRATLGGPSAKKHALVASVEKVDAADQEITFKGQTAASRP